MTIHKFVEVPPAALHQRRKKAKHVLKDALRRVSGTFLEGDFMTGRKGGEKILFYRRDACGLIHPDAALKMKIETAKIQICGSHSGCPVIGYKRF